MSNTNHAVQLQTIARGLKFWMWTVKGLHYLYSENKGVDQLVTLQLICVFVFVYSKSRGLTYDTYM